jgi:hypothetical protein
MPNRQCKDVTLPILDPDARRNSAMPRSLYPRQTDLASIVNLPPTGVRSPGGPVRLLYVMYYFGIIPSRSGMVGGMDWIHVA